MTYCFGGSQGGGGWGPCLVVCCVFFSSYGRVLFRPSCRTYTVCAFLYVFYNSFLSCSASIVLRTQVVCFLIYNARLRVAIHEVLPSIPPRLTMAGRRLVSQTRTHALTWLKEGVWNVSMLPTPQHVETLLCIFLTRLFSPRYVPCLFFSPRFFCRVIWLPYNPRVSTASCGILMGTKRSTPFI